MNRYKAELRALSNTYRHGLNADNQNVEEYVASLREAPAYFVASGGALAVAQLAADLHECVAGQMARALTPLDLSGVVECHDASVTIVSARVKHPDVALAVRLAMQREARVVGLITFRRREELSNSIFRRTTVVTLPPAPASDGFLATTSVLLMAQAFARAYYSDDRVLPANLSLLAAPSYAALRRHVLVLRGPRYAAFGIDLEARLSETGLATAQVADYRNFSHGRHRGLMRNHNDISIVAAVAPEIEQVSSAVLDVLPNDTDVRIVRTEEPWPASAIDLICGSMWLVSASAEKADIDPGETASVPAFGRKLYAMKAAVRSGTPEPEAVRRKRLAAGLPAKLHYATMYQQQFVRWLSRLQGAEVGGFVLDYDGTCCETHERDKVPSSAVQHELLRLLDAGALLGFASGRGRSLHRDLASWVPRLYWDQITVGLYNGALIVGLSAEMPDREPPGAELMPAMERIVAGVPSLDELVVEERRWQISVSPRQTSSFGLGRLATTIREVVEHPPGLNVTVRVSGHSVDINGAATGKHNVLLNLETRAGAGRLVSIGDQGQHGGNDFDLLAATPYSLSVDRCSADLTRCWNIAASSVRGPEALARYLRSFRVHGNAFQFTLDAARSQ